MLLWVRRVGKEWHHDLYRSTDSVTVTLAATPQLDVRPMQITDIFSVPTVGLMALTHGPDSWPGGPLETMAINRAIRPLLRDASMAIVLPRKHDTPPNL